jgi:dGTPase
LIKKQRFINILKHFSYIALINSSRLKITENRGQEMIKKIFNKLDDKEGYLLLPEDFQQLYKKMRKEADRKRLICDFIAGMTDSFAVSCFEEIYWL